MAVQCPNCGFPNLEGSPECISCKGALPASVAGDHGDAGFRMGMGGVAGAEPAGSPAPDATAPAPAPPPPANPQASPRPISTESIEMFFPERHGEMPMVAGANPDFAADTGTAEPPPGWTSQHALHPTGAGWGQSGAATDPWLSATEHPQALASATPVAHRPYAPPRPQGDTRRFAPTDSVTVVGIVGIFLSLLLPWAEKIPLGGEGETVSAADFPVSFVITGSRPTYPLPWLTVFLVMAAVGVAAAIALVASNKSSSYVLVSTAGIVALLIPAGVLVKLASLQEDAEVGTTFTHGIGIYVAIVSALVMLAGATLRSNRLKSKS